MKKLLLLAGATLAMAAMAACADSTTAPAPTPKAASAKASHDGDFECRSGYIVAYDENGNPYCVPE